MKKAILNLALLASSSVALAGTPDAIVSNSETKTNSFPNEYWVIAKLNATTYQLSSTEPDGPPCSGGPEPCRITTAADHSSNLQISVSELSNPCQASIEETQPLL